MKPLLSIAGLCHSYGRHQVLKNLSLEVAPGEVLGIIGENGAGKSTLVKCILGIERPTAGTIRLDCQAAAIHQELNLADDLPAYANFFLGREIATHGGFLDLARMAEATKASLARFGIDIDPEAETGSLPVSIRQMLEIARAIDTDAKLLILDEPTALLDSGETETLFGIMRTLRAQGKGMIYISHRLAEISEICDRVAVLRDGELAGAGRAADLTQRQMAEMMVGRELADIYPEKVEPAAAAGFSFTAPSVGALEVRAGEILGLAGMADAGQRELGEALAGFRPLPAGAAVAVGGKAADVSSPEAARAAGIAFLSPDRAASGIWRDFSVSENVALGSLDSVASRGCILREKAWRAAEESIAGFNIKCEGPDDPLYSLSGGNQQKVSLAKTLAPQPKAVILNEPTQGVDVGARREIYSSIASLAAQELAILLISSDMTELIGLCRRIAVMKDGKIAGELAGGELTEKGIIRLATGA